MGGGTKNWKQERLQSRGEKVRAARELEHERQGWQMLSAKVKTASPPPIGFINHEACSLERTPRTH
jgi:hypothetical protein